MNNQDDSFSDDKDGNVSKQTNIINQLRCFKMQRYQIPIRFEGDALKKRINDHWLIPKSELGVIDVQDRNRDGGIRIILVHQGQNEVTDQYEIDERKPLHSSWPLDILDTAAIYLIPMDEEINEILTVCSGKSITIQMIQKFLYTVLDTSEQPLCECTIDVRHLLERELNERLFRHFKDNRVNGLSGNNIGNDHTVQKSSSPREAVKRSQGSSEDPQSQRLPHRTVVRIRHPIISEPVDVIVHIDPDKGTMEISLPDLIHQEQDQDIHDYINAQYDMVEDVHRQIMDDEYHMKCRISMDMSTTSPSDQKSLSDPNVQDRKRMKELDDYRKKYDPENTIIGTSPTFIAIINEIYEFNRNKSAAHMLITGETGTGKTHLAKFIHESSNRRKNIYKEVNAADGGGDPNLQRGEWVGFGNNHGLENIPSKGKPGHLEEVNDGTLFVDECTLLSPELQGIFLSALEGRDINKVGGNAVRANVRCIFATNEDLKKAVKESRFRQDLLARIYYQIHIPPLRKRKGDALLFTRHFLKKLNLNLSSQGMLAMLMYQWPENVRELKKIIELAATGSGKAKSIDIKQLKLPNDILNIVHSKSNDECNYIIWNKVVMIARREGFEHGHGLIHRVGEIMGVSDSQASKMCKKYIS